MKQQQEHEAKLRELERLKREREAAAAAQEAANRKAEDERVARQAEPAPEEDTGNDNYSNQA